MLKNMRIINGQSAAKLRTGEGSTTIPQGSRHKCAEVESTLFIYGEDIVCTSTKVEENTKVSVRFNEP